MVYLAMLAIAVSGALASASARQIDLNPAFKAIRGHCARGNYVAAQAEAQRVERVLKMRVGTSHPKYNNLAIVYGAERRSSEAEGHYKRALAFKEKARGVSNPDVA